MKNKVYSSKFAAIFSMEGFAHTHKKTLQMRCFRCYNGKKEEWK